MIEPKRPEGLAATYPFSPMPSYKRVIHWFRRDLRLTDNLALRNAVDDSEEVIPVYVVNEWKGGHHWTGPGRQQFLCGCLESLSGNLTHAGGKLVIRQGEAVGELEKLIREFEVEAVYLNRDPDPFGREVEGRLKELCRSLDIGFHDFNDCTLHEPDAVLTNSGTPYRVYTPYSKAWFELSKPEPVARVAKIHTPHHVAAGDLPTLATWGLEEPEVDLLAPGEKAARKRMRDAVDGPVTEYAEKRNDPSAEATSRLGCDLRYGTISVRELFQMTEKALSESRSESRRKSVFTFQKQLAWREFFMGILWHFPEVLETDFNEKWRDLEWDEPGEKFERWQEGRTGFPIVDAGMRQLKATGYMHNRVRMITAMFLTKDLHVYWRHGEAHFLRHLIDGEVANNNGGWQWSSGTGADAAPYFRIQNPWTQTERHDPDGEYIKRWVPELENVDPKAFTKPPGELVPIADDYPAPIVDHSAEREETLRRFKDAKD